MLIVPLIAAALILSSAGPATAVTPDRTMFYEGTGDAVIWPFWVADGSTDTLFEVVNRITRLPRQLEVRSASLTGTGVRKARWILVHFIIHEDKDSNDARDFNICLSPGDVWTAALTLQSGVTHLKSSDLSSGPPDSPLSDLGTAPVDITLQPVSAGQNPIRGYIAAVMIDNGTTEQTGCDGDHFSTNPFTHQNDFAIFGGSSFVGLRDPLLGRAIYVNVSNGLATGFNAETIQKFCAGHPDRDCAQNATVKGKVDTFRALAMADHNRSVIGVLFGRWLRDVSKNFDTQVIVTFPAGKNQTFGICSGDPSTLPTAFGTVSCTVGADRTNAPGLDFRITASTTMALWIRNDEECVSLSARQIPTPNEVNVITFSTLADTLFRTTSSAPGGGTCKKPEQLATSGWFKLLFDLNEDEVTDGVTASFGPGPGGIPNGTQTVPHIIPAVGFVTMTAPTAGGRISATFPFQTERPSNFIDCKSGGGLSCTSPNTSP